MQADEVFIVHPTKSWLIPSYLKKAHETLEQKEPENNYDQNTLSVLINFGSGWNKVGYIAKDLTSELQPLIHNGNIKVNVA